MLRESAATAGGEPVDLAAVRDPFIDSGLPFGQPILAFVDAIVLRDDEELAIARGNLISEAGPAAAEAVAGVTANFEMMNRILDATGVPIALHSDDISEILGLDIPEHLRSFNL